MTVLALLGLVPLVLLLALLWRPELGNVPDEIGFGGLLVRFTTLDRISYLLALGAIAVGVVAGLLGSWLPRAGVVSRVLGSAGVVFLGAVLTLVLNRLVRVGRARPRAPADSEAAGP